jgi:hypothetical protein
VISLVEKDLKTIAGEGVKMLYWVIIRSSKKSLLILVLLNPFLLFTVSTVEKK